MSKEQKRYGQWLIVDRGLVGDRDYSIDRRDLLREYDDLYFWPIHMAHKGWINLDDFERAFRAALIRFELECDLPRLAMCFFIAREEKARSRFYRAVAAELFPCGDGLPSYTVADLVVVDAEVDRRLANKPENTIR